MQMVLNNSNVQWRLIASFNDSYRQVNLKKNETVGSIVSEHLWMSRDLGSREMGLENGR